ncbi:hypothetical protein SAE02_75180 [Skermanella aerolata]|uniref:Uncharacterized protein n=1 Tax=Skermanella aerolata TaxID=393310 RepID=A0A512E4F9_9PROT|nr:hypothetical protein N826_31325 [Skermanella aerolata KACC 11604]GEO43370.1 hypothetical protein SAE02_75180 [Skermanella aerolata]
MRKIKRAQILLAANADWGDEAIAAPLAVVITAHLLITTLGAMLFTLSGKTAMMVPPW